LDSNKSISCGAPFTKSKGKTSPPPPTDQFSSFEVKTRKYEGAVGKKDAGMLLIENLTEAGALTKPPQLMLH